MYIYVYICIYICICMMTSFFSITDTKIRFLPFQILLHRGLQISFFLDFFFFLSLILRYAFSCFRYCYTEAFRFHSALFRYMCVQVQ